MFHNILVVSDCLTTELIPPPESGPLVLDWAVAEADASSKVPRARFWLVGGAFPRCDPERKSLITATSMRVIVLAPEWPGKFLPDMILRALRTILPSHRTEYTVVADVSRARRTQHSENNRKNTQEMTVTVPLCSRLPLPGEHSELLIQTNSSKNIQKCTFSH